MVTEEVKKKASDSLTGKGVGFSVNYRGKEIHFTIGKLYLKTLIRISGEVAQLTKYSKYTKSGELIQSLSNNAPILARIIAIAIINSKPIPEKPKPDKKLIWNIFTKKKSIHDEIEVQYLNENQITEILLEALHSEDSNSLSKVVFNQMDSDYFFAATISIGGIDLLKRMEEMVTDPLSQSGEE
jgi:hypothetical protein